MSLLSEEQKDYIYHAEPEGEQMKNYTQVYVKNSFEAAEMYCKAFGAEITREFITHLMF